MPTATAQDQQTLGLIWQATQGLFNQFDTPGVIFLVAAYVLVGIVMLPNSAFGKRLGELPSYSP